MHPLLFFITAHDIFDCDMLSRALTLSKDMWHHAPPVRGNAMTDQRYDTNGWFYILQTPRGELICTIEFLTTDLDSFKILKK